MLKEIAAILSQIKEEDLDKFARFLFDSKTHRIFLEGNGGSSLTCQHFAADLEEIDFDTKCVCLNMARITALVNDYNWEDVYIKQLNHIQPGDVLIAVSVHGGLSDWSNNLTRAAVYAQTKKAKVLSLLGCDGGELAKISNFSIIVPSNSTPIIEGIHSVFTHLICEKIKEDKSNWMKK